MFSLCQRSLVCLGKKVVNGKISDDSRGEIGGQELFSAPSNRVLRWNTGAYCLVSMSLFPIRRRIAEVTTAIHSQTYNRIFINANHLGTLSDNSWLHAPFSPLSAPLSRYDNNASELAV